MTTTKKTPEKGKEPASTPDMSQMLRVLGLDEEKQKVLAELTAKQLQLDAAKAELEQKRTEADAKIAEINKEVEAIESRVEALEIDLDDLRGDIPLISGNGKMKGKAKPKANGTAEGKVSEEPGRGKKQCPACEKYVGVRSEECANCGHVFKKSEKSEKPKKGKKVEGGRGRREEGSDLASVVVRVLSRNPNGLKLSDIAKKAIAAGYKTSSQNLSQAVYNVLSKLKKEERVQKDPASKRYSLTETAA